MSLNNLAYRKYFSSTVRTSSYLRPNSHKLRPKRNILSRHEVPMEIDPHGYVQIFQGAI